MTRSLRSKEEFSRVFGEGVKRVGRHLVLYILPADEDARAVVASRKTSRTAVGRNRAKRLLREGLRAVLSPPGRSAEIARKLFPDRDEGVASGDRAPGLWIVALARRPILEAKMPEVRDEIERLLG